MLTIRRSADRGKSEIGWLKSYHTFSFSDYWDPEHMGFRALRVINDDTVKPGAGFGTHSHRDMEILTYVISGALGHKDSLGTGSTIRPGELQRMSAGMGVSHSEMNASQSEPVHFLQIWILPERKGIDPGYEQHAFSEEERRGKLRLVASRDGRDGAVTVHQDVELWATLLDPGSVVEHRMAAGRHAWVQIVRGVVQVDGQRLAAGDGAAISDVKTVKITGVEPSEVLLFDLA